MVFKPDTSYYIALAKRNIIMERYRPKPSQKDIKRGVPADRLKDLEARIKRDQKIQRRFPK